MHNFCSSKTILTDYDVKNIQFALLIKGGLFMRLLKTSDDVKPLMAFVTTERESSIPRFSVFMRLLMTSDDVKPLMFSSVHNLQEIAKQDWTCC